MPFEERRQEAPSPPPPLTPPTPPTPPPPVPPVGQGSIPPGEEPKYVAWEDREHVGFWNGIWQTWVESVFNPDKFYSRLPYKGGLGSPILYALIILWATAIIDSAYRLIFANFWLGMFRNYMSRVSEFGDLGDLSFASGLTFLSFITRMLIAPAAILIGLFVISGIYHVITMIFGWTKRDYEATFRAIAYSAGPAIFAIVPFCGSPIGAVWGLVLAIIGLKHMQQTTGGKAAFVILIPLILCCCLAIILAIIFGAAIMALIGRAAHSGYSF